MVLPSIPGQIPHAEAPRRDDAKEEKQAEMSRKSGAES
jgi:hypothetical protein